MYDSFLYAADQDSHDVSIVFDGRVILGTRARKERSKSFNAFSSVDYPEAAVIRDGKLIRYLAPRQYSYGPSPPTITSWRSGSSCSPSSPAWRPSAWTC